MKKNQDQPSNEALENQGQHASPFMLKYLEDQQQNLAKSVKMKRMMVCSRIPKRICQFGVNLQSP